MTPSSRRCVSIALDVAGERSLSVMNRHGFLLSANQTAAEESPGVRRGFFSEHARDRELTAIVLGVNRAPNASTSRLSKSATGGQMRIMRLFP